MRARIACAAILGMSLAWLCGCESTQATNQVGRDPAASSGLSLLNPPKQQQDAAEDDPPGILPGTHMAAARLHESQNRPARAAEQYRQVIAIDPQNVEGYNRLGIVLDRLARFKEADDAFQQAIRIAPHQAHLRNNLGFSYMMQSRWRDAERELKAALEIQPHFTRARVNLGVTLAQQDRYDEARGHFELALPSEDAWYNLGLMYQSRDRTVEAARAFQIALEHNPRLVAAQKRLEMLPPETVAAAAAFTFERTSPALRLEDVATASTLEDGPATQPAEEAAGEVVLAEVGMTVWDEPCEWALGPESETAVGPEPLEGVFNDFPWADPFASPLAPFGHERRLGPVKDEPPGGDAAVRDLPVRLDARQRLIFLWQAVAMPMQRLFGPPADGAQGAIVMGSPLPVEMPDPEPAEPLSPPTPAPAP